jgi:hypothetical protein
VGAEGAGEGGQREHEPERRKGAGGRSHQGSSAAVDAGDGAGDSNFSPSAEPATAIPQRRPASETATTQSGGACFQFDLYLK